MRVAPGVYARLGLHPTLTVVMFRHHVDDDELIAPLDDPWSAEA
jgi:hypothetical protein